MAPTNRTSGKAPKEAPAEPFKRAVAGCFKAIAGVAEFEVTFASERPALAPDRVRLPEPPRPRNARARRNARGCEPMRDRAP